MDPAIEYLNFDLWVERGADGSYVVRGDSPHGQPREIATGDLATLGAGDAALGDDTAEPPYARDLGVRLHKYLFTPAVRSVLDQCLGATSRVRGQQVNQGVRIRLRISDQNPEISAIPWEFLYSEATTEFMGSSDRTPVVRFLEGGAVLPPEAWLPLKLLVVIPTAADLDVDGELRGIREALEKIEPPVQLIELKGPVTRKDLEQEFSRQNIDFLHFIGHGRVANGQGALRLNQTALDPDWITGEELREMIKNHRSLRLVVLNSCNGAKGATSNAFAGVAPQLIKGGVPAVVAMQYEIKDTEAKTFAHAFYQALFQGSGRGCVDVAITAGRAALSRDYFGRRSVGLPVLYIRYHEGVLFRLVKGPEGTTPERVSLWSAAKDRAVIREAERGLAQLGPGDDELRKEQEGIIERARKRIRYRTRAILTPVSVILFLILALLSGLFERVPLTWIAAASPVWFGDPLAGDLPVDSIILVTTKDSMPAPWRGNHARLLDQLSRAKARVVAFDARFQAASDSDAVLAVAVDSARARGTAVIDGANRLEGSQLALTEPLKGKVLPGIDCLGENALQFNDIVPLLWFPSEDEGYQPAFVLAVVNAWRRTHYKPDFEQRRVNFDDGHRVVDQVSLTKVTTVFGDQEGCDIMRGGTQYGEMLAVRAPLSRWRDPGRRFDYRAVLASPIEELDWARDRIVLVGSTTPSEAFKQRVGFRTTVRYGVERHADGIATIMGNAETRPVGRLAEFLIVMVFALWGMFLASRSAGIRFRRALLITSGVFGALVVISTALYWGQNRLLNLLYPLLGFVLTFFVLLRLRVRWHI